MRFTYYLCLLSTLSISVSSCIPDAESDLNDTGSAIDTEFFVPEGFDFSMTYEQEIAIVAMNEQGEPMSRIQFFLFSAPPEEGGTLLHRGLTDLSGTYHATVQVIAHQQAIYAYTPYLDLVRTQRIEVDGDPVDYEWGSTPPPVSGIAYRTAIDTTFGCDPSFFQVIGKNLKKLDVISGTYMTLGAASTNYNGIGYNYEDGMMYGFKKINNSDVQLWRLNPNGQESNFGSIGLPNTSYVEGHYKGDFDLNGDLYCVYGNIKLGRLDVDSLPLTAYEIPLSKLNNVDSDVHDIAYNEKFDKFYTVARNGHILVIDHQAATVQDVGDFSSVTGRGPFGAVWCINSGEVFYSQNNTGNIYRADLDGSGNPISVSFQISGEQTNNNDGSGCVLAESPFNDIDQDGIPNGNDDYPESGDVAFATFTPDKISYGTYAFEDFWPKKGDYDFNDLVIGYNYEAAKDTLNQTHWLIMNFKLRAMGAGFKSGFGLSFNDLLPSQIESVTGTSTTEVSIASNGCENGQSKAVIIIFDNGHKEFGVPVGNFVNTEDSSFTREAVNYSVRVNFTNPISDIGTFNPFIFTRGDRGYEIHLMNHEPTDLANTALFGTESDRSVGNNYYVDSQGFPWGLHFPNDFAFPIEKSSVRSSYNDFDSWVTTKGIDKTDWYFRKNAVSNRVILNR